MALRRLASKRLFKENRSDSTSSVHALLKNSSLSLKAPIAALNRAGFTQAAPVPSKLPEFLPFPVWDKLLEKLSPINVAGENVTPPFPSEKAELSRVTVSEARKILRSAQLEKLRLKLREIPANSISYIEFVNICRGVCENGDQGLEFARTLDQSGNVIVLGNVVFLRPHQVAKSIEKMIRESMALPNDPRRQELEELEKQKEMIDQKAESRVRAELYSGLGFLALQTLGLMRLTFWELSWDVMEPICFFVTSLHCLLAYGFFLRTAKEPSFEGFFRRRFEVKQRKLMMIHNFDSEKYNKLCRAFHSR